MNRAQVIQQVILGLLLGVLVFFGVEWLLKVGLSHFNAQGVCDSIPFLSAICLLWIFRLDRNKYPNLVARSRQGGLRFSILYIIGSFVLYFAALVLEFCVCTCVPSPPPILKLTLWPFVILLWDLWIISSIFDPLFFRSHRISIFATLFKWSQKWGIKNIDWWPLVTEREFLETMYPGVEWTMDRKWECGVLRRGALDRRIRIDGVSQYACGIKGWSTPRENYLYMYTLESTTEPKTIPYETFPKPDGHQHFSTVLYLISEYSGLVVEMLTGTTNIALAMEIKGSVFSDWHGRPFLTSASDAYNIATEGYTLVEHGRIKGKWEDFVVMRFDDLYRITELWLTLTVVELIEVLQSGIQTELEELSPTYPFLLLDDHETRDTFRASFARFLTCLRSMPQLAQNLGLPNKWTYASNDTPAEPSPLRYKFTAKDTDSNGDEPGPPASQINFSSMSSSMSGSPASPMEVNAPTKHAVHLINRLTAPPQLKYLPLCTGTTVRLYHAEVRILDGTAEDDATIFKRIRDIYNQQRGWLRRLFSWRRLRRVERVKVHLC
jgi:hypothetical protein